MKVLFLATGDTYGSSQALLSLIELLDKDIIPIVVYSLNNGLGKILQERNIKSYHIYLEPNSYPSVIGLKNKVLFLRSLIKSRFRYYSSCRLLESVIRLEKPDIIHSNVGVYSEGFMLARKYNIPHVWHLREYQDKDFQMKFLWSKKNFLRKLESNGNYNIAITKGVSDYFGNLPNTTIIYDGVISCNQIVNTVEKENYFLFVGNISAPKGIDTLVYSYIIFCKYNNTHKLLIAGDDSTILAKKLKKIVNDNKLEDRIIFLGFRQDRFELMQKATALIVPSLFEAFGLITAEAMFNNCIVIGRNTAGTKEQFDNAFNYKKKEIGFRYQNDEELIQILNQIINLPHSELNLRLKLGHSVVKKMYSKEQNALAIQKLYKQILK